MSFAPRPHAADDVADAVSAAKAPKLGFDDIQLPSGGVEFIPDRYGNLTWLGAFAVGNPAVFLKGRGDAGSGFFTGETSGKQVAFNNDGKGVGISATGHLDLQSVELTAGVDKKLVVDIYAYHGSTQVAHDRVTLTDAKATLVKLNYTGVTEVDFIPGKGTHDAAFKDEGAYIVFDDFAVTNILNGKFAAPVHLDGAHGTSFIDQTGHAFGHPGAAGHLDSMHMVHPIA